MFTVCDLCPLFFAVNQQSIMKPLFESLPHPLLRPLSEAPPRHLCWHLGTLEKAVLAHPDANTRGPQNAGRMLWTCHAGTFPRDVSPECRIEILQPAFACHRLRRNVMNVPSCYRHKCSHRLLQHIGHHLTQMCCDDGSSFFSLISLFFPRSSICQGPLDKQVKNIIQSRSCLEWEDWVGKSRRRGWILWQ